MFRRLLVSIFHLKIYVNFYGTIFMAFFFSFVLFCFVCFCFCTASTLTFVQRKLLCLSLTYVSYILFIKIKRDLMRTNSNTDNRIVKNFLQCHYIEIHALMLSAWEP